MEKHKSFQCVKQIQGFSTYLTTRFNTGF